MAISTIPQIKLGENGSSNLNTKQIDPINANFAQCASSAVDVLALKAVHADTNEPTGFIDRADSTIALVDETRTFTIAPAVDDFSCYCKGVKFTKSAAESIVITDVEGDHYIYYVDGVLTHSATFDIAYILENSLIAIIYWDATNKVGALFDERHGCVMDGVTHAFEHETLGARYGGGLALNTLDVDGNGDDATAAQFGVDSGTYWDEDIAHSIDAVVGTTGLEIWYLDGSDWRWTTEAGYSVLTTGSGRAAYNNSGSQSEVSNRDFVLCHVFAINSIDAVPIAIQGQAKYTSTRKAREGANVELAALNLAGLPSPEFKPLFTLIFQTADNYSNAVQSRVISTDTGADAVDHRLTTLTQVGTAVASSSFDDGQLDIFNTSDTTKKIDFDASNITTANTRTIIMADADVDLGDILSRLDALEA